MTAKSWLRRCSFLAFWAWVFATTFVLRASFAYDGHTTLAAKELGRYEVGSYNVLREGAEAGLDAHHVGQKALMRQFVEGYDPRTAPSILVPKAGHTIGEGVVSRNMSGFNSARDVIARDIRELRRVYPDIPNNQLQRLIELNKQMYPEVRR